MAIELNKSLYSGELFKVWTEKTDLLPIEAYFITKYLSNKAGKTIEAGTGGGRIIFEMEKLGFSQLAAFDYVEKMIGFCNTKKKELKSSVAFLTADATNLHEYDANAFDYLIYLQQILSFSDEENISKALKEAYRIGKPNSIYLFSFLNWNLKFYNPVLSFLVNFFRILRSEKTDIYKLPWLIIDRKFNWKFLNKNQPQNLWFKQKQIIKLLEANDFAIIEVKSKINSKNKNGHIHIACSKALLDN